MLTQLIEDAEHIEAVADRVERLCAGFASDALDVSADTLKHALHDFLMELSGAAIERLVTGS